MKFNKKTNKGFTVLELLVAMGVTAGIVVLLTSVTRVALDTYKSSSDEIRSSRMSQSALNDISSDLNSIVIPPNNSDVWLSVRAVSDPSLRVPGSGGAQPKAVELCFFSAVTDRYDGDIGSSNLGDVSAIRYVIDFNDLVGDALGSSSNSKVLNFYRQRIEPKDTYEKIITQFGNDNASIKSQPDYLPNLFNKWGGNAAAIENFLAENVFEFTITFEVKDLNDPSSDPKFIVVSSSANNSDHFLVRGDGIESPNGAISSLSSALWRLRSINVGLTLISDQGMDLISNGVNISGEELTRQYANSYSVKVELPETF